MTEVGTTYVNVIPKTEGFTESVASASKEAGGSAIDSMSKAIGDGLQSTIGNLTGTGGEMGSALSGGMEAFLSGAGKVAIVGAVASIAAAALAELESIGSEFDAMTDTIIIGTGASGEALEELRQTAMSVSQDVATSFATSGDIIQDFNTRLGLSGEDLQDVSTHAAKLNEILGGFNYDKMATMFNVWGVGADEMNEKMDYMFGVAQTTGIGFDKLTSIMQSSGPTLQNLGFSFEESANMAGLLDKSGIDASSTMSRRSKALVELSGAGEPAQDAFRRMVGEMQAYLDAGDTASAMDLAETLFGTRGAAQFIGALQSGAMNMEELGNAALGAGGNIDETYASIESWPQLWQRIQNSVAAALEPFGTATFELIGTLLDMASQKMTELWTATEPARIALNDFAAGMEPLATDVMAAVGEVKAAFDEAMPAIGALVEEVWPHIQGIVETVMDILKKVVPPIWEGIKTTISNVMNAIKAVIETVWPIISGIVETSVEHIESVIDGLSMIVDVVSGIFDGVKSAIEDPISTAQGIIEDAMSTIEGIFNGLDLSLPDIALPHFNVWGGEFPWGVGGMGAPPEFSIDWYAKGGFADGATLAGYGEKGLELFWPGYDPYFEKYAKGIADHMPKQSAAGVDIHDCTFNVRKDSDIRAVAVELNTLINRQTAGGIA